MVRSRFLYVPIDDLRSRTPGSPGIPGEPGPTAERSSRLRRPETAGDRTGRPGNPDRSDRSDQPLCRVGWRLIGANNRELGRSSAASEDMDECRAAVVRLREGIGEARALLTMSDSVGTWTWRLELAGQELAMSGRTYQRQREAQHNVALFLAAVPLAQVNEAVPNRPRLRGLRPPEPAGEGPGASGATRADADARTAGLLAAAHPGGRVRP